MFISKKILYAVGGLTILLIVFLTGLSFGNRTGDLQSEQTASVMNISEINTEPQQSGELAKDEQVKVVRVVDGDTINVEINGKVESVRYIGIDTPETVDPRKPVQCFGVEASKKNKGLVEGKMVRLEKDITDRDKYDRLLRYVWLGDTLINQTLVEQGYAKSYSYPPNVKYQDKFVAAEKKAREDKLGLWTACTSETPAVTPATIRTPSSASDPSCTIKGNISSSGEKIYHMQGCGSYAKTVINESRGEIWFCAETEAQSAGWRKALNCH
ncbi:MAG: thermonuclease family protein [Candidatus Paceibacterota bacterium]